VSRRRAVPLLLAAALTFGAAAVADAVRTRQHHGETHRLTPGRAPEHGQRVVLALDRRGAAGSARARLSALAVERRFTDAYLRFLDGRLTPAGLPDATITSRDQATAGGRLPTAMRDGPLRIQAIRQDGATRYSAQATVTAADRQARLPFQITLIRDRDGWWVSGLQAPDLDADRPTASPQWPPMPAPERRAAAAFAHAYLESLTSAHPPAMTATARRQLRLGQAPLTGIRREAKSRTLGLQLRYGPLEGDQFAATATARVAGRRRSFTFLMLRVHGRWECDAFL
jgi:hypothetical protein